MHKPLPGITRDRYFTDFNDQSPADDEFIIPADLTELSDDDLTALHTRAEDAFAALFNDGNPAADAMEALGDVTAGLEAILAENSRREDLAAERAEAARAMAERVGLSAQTQEDDGDDEDDDEDADEEEEEDGSEDEGAGETEALAVDRRIRAPRRQLPPPAEPAEPSLGIKDIMRAVGKGTTYADGTGIDWEDAGRIVDQRYARFKPEQFAAAERSGRGRKETHPVLSITQQFSDDLRINSTDRTHVDAVLQHAANESRLNGGSLVAAGGWCAPSEVTYDLLELESRDGIFTLPEVNLPRGGILRTLGPDFSALYALGQGFAYTEDQDIAGEYEYDADTEKFVEGPKPCVTLPCPDFDEFRLGIVGICINAGILAQRGYPEAIARTLRGVLVAHDHIKAGRTIADIVAGSTAVAMPAGQVGAVSPILNAVEMQVEHYKYTHRISRSTTLEAVFPFWVRGLIRTDLARRENIDVFSVTDAQINNWFALRGIAPQFVYNWQDVTGDADDFTAWPTSVQFLLYAAGTWVRGTNDLITLETQFDSALLAQNDYNALFTEEGHRVFDMNHDSRVITVPVDATGAYAAPVDIAHDGTLVVPAEG